MTEQERKDFVRKEFDREMEEAESTGVPPELIDPEDCEAFAEVMGQLESGESDD